VRAWTHPGMYAQLLASSYLSTTCQSFRFVPTNTAQDIMRRKRSRMLLAEDPALLNEWAPRVATAIESIPGVVDVLNGIDNTISATFG